MCVSKGLQYELKKIKFEVKLNIELGEEWQSNNCNNPHLATLIHTTQFAKLKKLNALKVIFGIFGTLFEQGQHKFT